jgi:hypothetical protein
LQSLVLILRGGHSRGAVKSQVPGEFAKANLWPCY